jgi:HNH endonuclease
LGQCALAGYMATNFLVALHIKPWRAVNDLERLDTFNGILLAPNLDKAFDLGYISFNEHGGIKLSEFIETPEKLGIEHDMKIELLCSIKITWLIIVRVFLGVDLID